MEPTRHASWSEPGCSDRWLIQLSIDSRTIWLDSVIAQE